MNLERISLATLHGGGAIEQFDDELDRVLQNITDINTGDGVRSVTLKVEIRPDKDRSFGAVKVQVSSKVQPSIPFATQMFFGREKGRTVGLEHNPEQMRLELNPPIASAVSIGKEG